MRIDEHPYLFLYIVGGVLSFILIVLGTVVSGTVGWITRANIVNKNLKKLLPPQTFAAKAGVVLWTLAFSVALSWINVLLVLLWQIPVALLGTLRELFSSTPEAIKLLRFPLKNNPYMSREAVWAYVQALQIKLGQTEPSEAVLIGSLDELLGYYPTVNRMTALTQLRALNVLNPEVVAAALDRLSKPEEVDGEDFLSDTLDHPRGPKGK